MHDIRCMPNRDENETLITGWTRTAKTNINSNDEQKLSDDVSRDEKWRGTKTMRVGLAS